MKFTNAAGGRTALEKVSPPAGMLTALRSAGRESSVLTQSIGVDLDWWNTRLGEVGGPLTVAGATSGTAGLDRREVFTHSAAAQDSREGALRLLWYSMAWGAGSKRRLCSKRISTTGAGGEAAASALQRAAQLARDEPVQAYKALRPGGGNLIAYLGPAFFTKFLYFAGGDHPDNRSAILDARVAASLRGAGWTSLGSGNWPVDTYRRYIELIERWQAELSIELERPVALDEIEKWLFKPTP